MALPIFKLLVILIVAVVLILVSIGTIKMAKTAYETNSTSFVAIIFKKFRPYSFDMSTLVRYPAEENQVIADNYNRFFLGRENMFETQACPTGVNESEFCSTLKSCIVTSIKNNGAPCLVADLKYPYSTSNDNGPTFNPVGRYRLSCCFSAELYEPISGGKRKICDFYVDNAHPSYIPSFVNKNEYKIFWGHMADAHMNNPSEIFRDPNGATFKSYVVYNHPDYGQNILQSDNQPGRYPATGGRYRIVLADADIGSDEECEYNVYVAAQPAFSYSNDSSIISVFEYFRDFDIYKNFTVGSISNWAAAQPFEYPYLHVTMDYVYTLRDVIFAIESGLFEWDRKNYDNVDMIQYLDENSDANYIFMLSNSRNGETTMEVVDQFNIFINSDSLPRIVYQQGTDLDSQCGPNVYVNTSLYTRGVTTESGEIKFLANVPVIKISCDSFNNWPDLKLTFQTAGFSGGGLHLNYALTTTNQYSKGSYYNVTCSEYSSNSADYGYVYFSEKLYTNVPSETSMPLNLFIPLTTGVCAECTIIIDVDNDIIETDESNNVYKYYSVNGFVSSSILSANGCWA